MPNEAKEDNHSNHYDDDSGHDDDDDDDDADTNDQNDALVNSDDDDSSSSSDNDSNGHGDVDGSDINGDVAGDESDNKINSDDEYDIGPVNTKTPAEIQLEKKALLQDLTILRQERNSSAIFQSKEKLHDHVNRYNKKVLQYWKLMELTPAFEKNLSLRHQRKRNKLMKKIVTNKAKGKNLTAMDVILKTLINGGINNLTDQQLKAEWALVHQLMEGLTTESLPKFSTVKSIRKELSTP